MTTVGEHLVRAQALRDRALATGDPAAYRELVDFGRRLVKAVGNALPPAQQAPFHMALGFDLCKWYETTRDATVLPEAIAALREARRRDPDEPVRSMVAEALGVKLRDLHGHTHDRRPLAEAVELLRAARPQFPEDVAEHHYNLGLALADLGRLDNDVTLLREAVPHLREASGQLTDGRLRGYCLLALGAAVEEIGRRSGAPAAGTDDLVRAGAATLAAQGDPAVADEQLWEHLSDRADHAPEVIEELLAVARRLAARRGPREQRARHHNSHCLSLRTAYKATGDPRHLDEAVPAGRKAVKYAKENYRGFNRYLANLAAVLRLRGALTQDRPALLEAVEVARQALACTPVGHEDHSGMRGDLAAALLATAREDGGDLEVFREAAGHARAALDGPARYRETYLPNLALALHGLVDGGGEDPELLAEAIAVHRECLALTMPPARRAATLFGLARVLAARVRQAGSRAATGEQDAAAAAAACREALALLPAGDERRTVILRTYVAVLGLLVHFVPSVRTVDDALAGAAEALATLKPAETELATMLREVRGHMHWFRFELTGDLTDLDGHVAASRAALADLAAGSPERGEILNLLGIAYRLRCKTTGSPEDLDEAVRLGAEAITVAPGDPRHPAWLAHQCANLRELHEINGRLPDLDLGIRLAREALEIERGALVLTHLSSALGQRHDATGDPDELEEALRHARAAVRTVPPETGVSSYVALTTCLLKRYELWGIAADLDEAVELARTALEHTGEHDIQRPIRLARMAATLRMRYARYGDPADRTAALEHAEQAAALPPPGSPQRVNHLIGLLAAYLGTMGDEDDGWLDRLITLAAKDTGPDAPEVALLPSLLGNLGQLHDHRFDLRGDQADRARAIAAWRRALDLTPASHPQRANYALAISQGLSDRHPGEARMLARDAATHHNAPVELRLRAAYRWATLAPAGSDEAVDAYRELITQLTLIGWHGAPRSVREERLGRWTGVAGLAAAAMLDSDRPEVALELLDQGRAVLWSQLLDARTELDGIAREDPQLADGLLAAREVLDEPAAPERFSTEEEFGTPDSRLLKALAAAQARAASGDVDGAIAALRPLTEADHPAIEVGAAGTLGDLLAAKGDSDGAEQAYRRGIETGAVTLAAYPANRLGNLLLRRPDLPGARTAFEQARDLAQGDPDATTTAAKGLRMVAAWESDPSGAAATAEANRDTTDPARLLALAEKLLADGRITAARPMAERAHTLAPPPLRPYTALVLGDARARDGDPAAARSAYEEATTQPDRPEIVQAAALRLADLLVEEGLGEEAAHAYRRAAKGPDPATRQQAHQRLATLSPPGGESPAEFDFGRFVAHGGDPAEAVAALAGAATTRALIFLGLALAAAGREGAQEAYRRAVLAAGPGNGAAREFARAMLRFTRGDHTGGGAAFEASHAAATSAGDAELAALSAWNLATARLDADGLASARPWFERSIASGHRHYTPVAAIALAYALLADGDRTGAQATLRRVIATGHPYLAPDAAIQLGDQLLAEGDASGAEGAFRFAVKGARPDAAAHAATNLARMLHSRGDDRGAEEMLYRAARAAAAARKR